MTSDNPAKVYWHTEIRNAKLNVYQKSILHALASRGSAFPGLPKLAEDAGCSRAKVAEEIKTLRELGWLTWDHQKGRSNVYTLSLPNQSTAWTTQSTAQTTSSPQHGLHQSTAWTLSNKDKRASEVNKRRAQASPAVYSEKDYLANGLGLSLALGEPAEGRLANPPVAEFYRNRQGKVVPAGTSISGKPRKPRPGEVPCDENGRPI